MANYGDYFILHKNHANIEWNISDVHAISHPLWYGMRKDLNFSLTTPVSGKGEVCEFLTCIFHNNTLPKIFQSPKGSNERLWLG